MKKTKYVLTEEEIADIQASLPRENANELIEIMKKEEAEYQMSLLNEKEENEAK